MIAAIKAEWTKLRTVPSTAWLLVAAGGATIAVSAIVTAAWHVNRGSTADPTKLSLTGIYVGQAVISVLAVLAVSEEYGTGMIRTTIACVPRRITLLTAKAASLAGLIVPVGLAAVGGCLLAGRLLLPDAGLNPAHGYALISVDHAATLRAAAGGVIYLILIGLLALGIATIIRDTAASIGAVFSLLYLPPIAGAAHPRPNLAEAHSGDRPDDGRPRDPGDPHAPPSSDRPVGWARHPRWLDSRRSSRRRAYAADP